MPRFQPLLDGSQPPSFSGSVRLKATVALVLAAVFVVALLEAAGFLGEREYRLKLPTDDEMKMGHGQWLANGTVGAGE